MDENILPEKYYGQTLEIIKDMANRNQDGLMGQRKMQGNWVLEIGWQLPRIVATLLEEAKAHPGL